MTWGMLTFRLHSFVPLDFFLRAYIILKLKLGWACVPVIPSP